MTLECVTRNDVKCHLNLSDFHATGPLSSVHQSVNQSSEKYVYIIIRLWRLRQHNI